MPALPHTIITNINHLLINLHDSVPQEIKSWADAREFESVLADHLKAVRDELAKNELMWQ